MPNLTGPIQAPHSDTSVVDSSKVVPTGTRVRDDDGNEYVYLAGVASTALGSWVTYNLTTGTTALLAASAVGPVAIAMASVDTATEYGWYQIFGSNPSASTDTVAAHKQLYIDGTAGRADDLAVVGSMIHGAISRTADTSNVATVEIAYPYVNNDNTN